MIETLGFVGAIEASDAAVKASNVEILEINSLDVGLVTVIFAGDVGAVNNALDAGVIAAEKVGQLYASTIIARPHPDCMLLFFKESDEGIGGTS